MFPLVITSRTDAELNSRVSLKKLAPYRKEEQARLDTLTLFVYSLFLFNCL